MDHAACPSRVCTVNVSQANLSHNSECTAKAVILHQDERISDDILEGECMADIRKWALGKKKKADVYRIIEGRYAPFKLREGGQRKVGDTVGYTCDVKARQCCQSGRSSHVRSMQLYSKG